MTFYIYKILAAGKRRTMLISILIFYTDIIITEDNCEKIEGNRKYHIAKQYLLKFDDILYICVILPGVYI
jgi:hypothetical protein